MYIDQLLLGRFRDGTTYTWLLSGMSFAAMVLLGVLAGHLLRSRWSGVMKVVWLGLLSVACLVAGWFWAGGFDRMLDVTWIGSWRFPIIKHLFTSSMVLWAGGWCYLLMAVFYLVMDVLGWRKWAYFFVVIGANPIFAYMIVHFVDFGDVSNRLLGGLAESGSFSAYGQTVGTALLALTAYAIFGACSGTCTARNATRV
jgi:predicted acyltransferase